MPALPTEKSSRNLNHRQFTVLELRVTNHPGMMSHICNLFARRAFNLEGILCMPVREETESRIWLRVKEDLRLEQLIKQLNKLWDVREVRCNTVNSRVFNQLENFFRQDDHLP